MNLQKNEKLVLVSFIILYLVGIVGLSTKAFQSLVLATSEIFLFITVGISLMYYIKDSGKKKTALVVLSIITLLTLLIEILGVKTGKIFGDYYYGSVFKINVLQVPVIIGLNWAYVIIAFCAWFYKLNIPVLLKSFFISLSVVAFDLILEPVAIHLDYWIWKDNEVPVQNYITWFILSFVFSMLVLQFKFKKFSIVLKLNLILQILFFILILVFSM